MCAAGVSRPGRTGVSNPYDDSSVGTPTDPMRVVVDGDAVRFLLSSSPEATQVERLTDAGVQVTACASSLARHGYSPDELAVGVRTVPSGVADVLRLQRHGDSYLKLP